MEATYAAAVPPFDLEQAKRLFFKGRSIAELVAAARRLGNAKLESDIRAFERELAQSCMDMDMGE
jgi:hypothetical protein